MQPSPTRQQATVEMAALAFEQAPAFMAVLSGPAHVFEVVNHAYYQLVGHRDILGKPVLIALPEMADQGIMELLDEVFHTGIPFIAKDLLLKLQVSPGSPLVDRYVDFVYQARRNADGEIIGASVHGVDVTDVVVDRQQSEARMQRLKQQAQTLDTVLSNVTDIICTFDRAGRFLYANQPFVDLVGIPLANIMGKTCLELPTYPPDLAVQVQAYIAHVVATGQPTRDETPYVNPAGKEEYYEYIFFPVFGDDGQLAVVAGSTRNITEQILQERQKDEFLAIVTHELKTPVTSLKAFTQILQKRLAKEGHANAVTQLAKMDAQINKLIALIGDLLDVTKINSGQLQFHEADFAVDAVVAEAIEEVQRTTEQHRIISESLTNQTLFGDKDRIGQVLINMLTNAIKYSPHADTILVKPTSDGATFTLAVQDFGMGISPEQLPHVFERFYRAPEEQQKIVPGLGLGLYIAAEIIQRHGGTMGVESTPGHGATFRFSLPIPASAQPDAHDTPTAHEEGTHA